MGMLMRYAAATIGLAAFCFLRSVIVGYRESNDSSILEISPANNYFIGLGSLLMGIAATMLVIELTINQNEQQPQPMLITIY